MARSHHVDHGPAETTRLIEFNGLVGLYLWSGLALITAIVTWAHWARHFEVSSRVPSRLATSLQLKLLALGILSTTKGWVPRCFLSNSTCVRFGTLSARRYRDPAHDELGLALHSLLSRSSLAKVQRDSVQGKSIRSGSRRAQLNGGKRCHVQVAQYLFLGSVGQLLLVGVYLGLNIGLLFGATRGDINWIAHHVSLPVLIVR